MCNILVAEDRESIIHSIEKFCESEGHKCVVVKDYHELKKHLQLADKSGIDIILLDTTLPYASFEQSIKCVENKYPDVKIIAMGNDDKNNDYDTISKPIRYNTLRDLVTFVT